MIFKIYRKTLYSMIKILIYNNKEVIIMVDKNEITKIASWVIISSYRNRIMTTLGGKLKTPSTLARESGVKINHISKVLKELKEKKLIVCINEEAHKGRLYEMTDLGHKVLKEVKRIKEL